MTVKALRQMLSRRDKTLDDFITNVLDPRIKDGLTLTEIHKLYRQWAQEHGLHILSMLAVSHWLRHSGFGTSLPTKLWRRLDTNPPMTREEEVEETLRRR